jgi:predicted transcriptional regulator
MTDSAAEKVSRDQILRMAVDVVAAYVGRNHLNASQIPEIISTVFTTLAGLEGGAATRELQKPAVPIKRSVSADYIVCLEDGKKLKMLKRHLRTTYGMTPDEYRAKWGLPADYPMVAPNYAAQRSAFAKQIGLGRKPGTRKGARGRGRK